MKFRNFFWDVDSSLMMEAVRTSETSVDNYFTQQYIPEKISELQCLRTGCREEGLALRCRKQLEAGDNWIKRSFVVCNLHPIGLLLGS
jgi:hypothetical protein